MSKLICITRLIFLGLSDIFNYETNSGTRHVQVYFEIYTLERCLTFQVHGIVICSLTRRHLSTFI